jgi:hypothetical protein
VEYASLPPPSKRSTNAAIVADQKRQVARILGGRQKPVARHKRRQET